MFQIHKRQKYSTFAILKSNVNFPTRTSIILEVYSHSAVRCQGHNLGGLGTEENSCPQPLNTDFHC